MRMLFLLTVGCWLPRDQLGQELGAQAGTMVAACALVGYKTARAGDGRLGDD